MQIKGGKQKHPTLHSTDGSKLHLSHGMFYDIRFFRIVKIMHAYGSKKYQIFRKPNTYFILHHPSINVKKNQSTIRTIDTTRVIDRHIMLVELEGFVSMASQNHVWANANRCSQKLYPLKVVSRANIMVPFLKRQLEMPMVINMEHFNKI